MEREEYMADATNSFKKIPYDVMHEKFVPFVNDSILNIQPDIIVTDFATPAGSIAANKFNMRLVLNGPATIQMLNKFGIILNPDMKEA